MSKDFVNKVDFIRASARYSDLVYVICKSKEMIENEIPHAFIFCVDAHEWMSVNKLLADTTAISVCKKPTEKMVAVSDDGEVLTFVKGVSTSERINLNKEGIRNSKAIDGYSYACGMGRQLFKRVDEDSWIDISAEDTEEFVAGFEAVDGFSENEIYCVGWEGEIWQYTSNLWKQHASPTNLILTSVCCADDGYTYIVGQAGVVIKGRNDTWSKLDLGYDHGINFWDICYFNGEIYIASINALFILKDNALVEVDYGSCSPPESCYSLTHAEGVLWSVGQHDVLSFDGKEWKSYTDI